MRASRPASQPPTSSEGGRPLAAGTLEVMPWVRSLLRREQPRGRIGTFPRARRAVEPWSVLEPAADGADRLLGHELGPGVEVGGRDAAVDLQIELHHGPEALQERLLAQRPGEIA